MFSNYPVYQKTTDSVSKKGAKAFRGTVVIFMVERERERESACSLTRQMPETTDPPPGLKVTVKDKVSMRQFYAWLDELPTILSINLSQARKTITIYNRILKV